MMQVPVRNDCVVLYCMVCYKRCHHHASGNWRSDIGAAWMRAS
jgi:hypothetical protein